MEVDEKMTSYYPEKNFDFPDAKNPKYAQEEFDISINTQCRYSMRKNLETGNYEFYRHYHDHILAYNPSLTQDEVQYTYRSFPQALIQLNRELKAIGNTSKYLPLVKSNNY